MIYHCNYVHIIYNGFIDEKRFDNQVNGHQDESI